MNKIANKCFTLGTLAFLVTVAGSSLPAAAAGKFYCCNDATGRQVCGDILPQACYGRAYRELGESGQTVRFVEAPLTPEQRAQRMAEAERRRLEEAALQEKKRKDQALLETYSSEKDIEVMRQRALSDAQKSIQAAEEKIAEIKAQRKKFEDEAEFYKKKKPPSDVQKGLSDADFEIEAQESIIEAKRKEIGLIQAKYDDDLRRFTGLTRRAPNTH